MSVLADYLKSIDARNETRLLEIRTEMAAQFQVNETRTTQLYTLLSTGLIAALQPPPAAALPVGPPAGPALQPPALPVGPPAGPALQPSALPVGPLAGPALQPPALPAGPPAGSALQ